MIRSTLLNRRNLFKSSVAMALFSRVTNLLGRNSSYQQYPKSVLRSSASDLDLKLNVLEGNYPTDLQGHALLLESMSDDTGIYVKSGKGAINRIDFSTEQATWKRKLIKTPSIQMAEAVQGSKYQFNPMAKMLYQSPKLGYMNTSNTNAVPMGDGRIALTFEGGRHWELCPEKLELLNPIGKLSEWKTAITGIPGYFNKNLLFPSIRTTAHPYYDKDMNELITINYGSKIRIKPLALGRPFTRVCLWDRKSELRSWNVIDKKNGRNVEVLNTSHSFLVTRNYIGIIDTPANVEAEIFIGLSRTRPSTPYTKIWWLKREDLKNGVENVEAISTTIKREFIDLVCDYNDDNGINVYSGSIQSSDQTEFLRDGDELFVGGKVRRDLIGLSSGPNDLSGFLKVHLSLDFENSKTTFKEEFLANDADLWGIDFPAYKGNYAFPETFKDMYWSTVGYNPDQILQRLVDIYKDQKFRNLPAKELPTTNRGAAIVHLDCENFAIAAKYVFPSNCALGSFQFIPRKGSQSQDDGYLISIVSQSDGFDSQNSSGQEMWIFDARDLSSGPLCKLGSQNLDIAYTLHSCWIEGFIEKDEHPYSVDLLEEAKDLIKKQDSNIQTLYKKIAKNFHQRSKQ